MPACCSRRCQLATRQRGERKEGAASWSSRVVSSSLAQLLAIEHRVQWVWTVVGSLTGCPSASRQNVVPRQGLTALQHQPHVTPRCRFTPTMGRSATEPLAAIALFYSWSASCDGVQYGDGEAGRASSFPNSSLLTRLIFFLSCRIQLLWVAGLSLFSGSRFLEQRVFQRTATLPA